MKYQSVEGNLFFQHSVVLTCKKDRIKELDEHLQTYGRRSIDWEIASQTKKAKEVDPLHSWRFLQATKKDGETVFFRKKSDGVRFKLSWDECAPEDPYDMGLSSMLKSIRGGIGSHYQHTIYPTTSGIMPSRNAYFRGSPKAIGWKLEDFDFMQWHTPGIDIRGQYLLDLDGKFKDEKSISAMEKDWANELFKVYADTESVLGTKMTQMKGRGLRGTVGSNPCREIILDTEVGLSSPAPAPASSSDFSS